MLNQFKLSVRLWLGFGLVLVFAGSLAVTGTSALSSVMSRFRIVSNDVLPKTRIATQNIGAAYDYARAFAYIVTSEGRPGVDEASIQRARAALVDTVKLVNQNVATLEKLLSSDQEKALLKMVVDRRAAYGKSRNHVLELKKTGENDNAVNLMFTETDSLQTAYIMAWKDFIAHEEGLLSSGVASSEENYAFAQRLLITISIIGLFVGLFVAASITRGLLKQLGGEPSYAVDVAGRIAAGDLGIAVEVHAKDSSSLMFAMKAMRDNLASIVGQVRTGTDTIMTASSEIASGNLDLSSRTEQQASSLEETASSMEELTSTVKQNADNARQANSMALAAADVAKKGGAVVAEVVNTMGSINESSRKIVDIISVIDGIAFQTNILALNAAVEAARAGEQGRGFAVVASEVRSLAQRSAAAAKEIKTLIGDSVDKVEIGAKLVDQAGATMDEIVDSVKRVTDIMSEISAASQEQTSGIEQVNQAIAQMDEVTQQNAALVEQAAAAAQSMQDQAANLSQVVSIFRISDQKTTRPIVAEPAPRAQHARKKLALA